MTRSRFTNLRQRAIWKAGRYLGRLHGRGPLLVAIGDSHTDPKAGYTLPWQVWLRIVGRRGYRTLNLGVGGDTTGQMRRRIEQTLTAGRPDTVVVFGGGNDAVFGVEPAETERNVAFMVEWLQQHGVPEIVLIGPALGNWPGEIDWTPAVGEVRKVLRAVAEQYGVIFIDLAQFLRDRIDRGLDPDFTRVPYRQSRSWHVGAGDPHFNAYGQRLIAEAFLDAIAEPPRSG
jgi:lysophospholipase L1-like esterase